MSSRWVTAGQGVVGVVFVLVGAAVPVLRDHVEFLAGWTVASVAGLLVVTGLATVTAAWRGSVLASVAATATGMMGLYLFATAVVYPAMEPLKSSRGFALEVKRVTAASRAAGHDVVAWQAGNVTDGIAFYSDGVYTVETGDVGVLADHLRRSALVHAIVRMDRIEELPQDVRDTMVVLHEERLSRRNLAIVANRPAAKE